MFKNKYLTNPIKFNEIYIQNKKVCHTIKQMNFWKFLMAQIYRKNHFSFICVTL